MARYIDADALIDFLDVGHLRHPSDLCFSEVDVANLLLHAPALSPDEVRGVGEWIWHDNYGWDDFLECSCCAEEFVVYDGEFPGIDSFKFCPNCGARMKGAEDGTTD